MHTFLRQFRRWVWVATFIQKQGLVKCLSSIDRGSFDCFGVESPMSLWTFIRRHCGAHLKSIPLRTLTPAPVSAGWKMRRGIGALGGPPVRPAWPSPLIQHHLVERTGNSHISLPTGTVGHYAGWIPISWTEGLRLNTEALDTSTYSQALCYILLSHS